MGWEGKIPRKRVLEQILTTELPWLRQYLWQRKEEVLPAWVSISSESCYLGLESLMVKQWNTMPVPVSPKKRTKKRWLNDKCQRVKLTAHGRKGSKGFEKLERWEQIEMCHTCLSVEVQALQKSQIVFSKAPQPGQGSSRSTALLVLGSQALCRGQDLYWQMDTFGWIRKSPELGVCVVTGVKPQSSSRVLWEALQCHHPGVSVWVQSIWGWSIHTQKTAGPHSLRKEVSHFKQNHSKLVLQCMVSCNSPNVEFGSEDTVNLASSCPEQAGGCVYPYWL